VLGYHGCDKAIADRAVAGEIDLIRSERDYDWLGPGAYFWESDPVRAKEFAEWKANRGDFTRPVVIGAVIDLRNCLDLVARENVELLRKAHKAFLKIQKMADLPIPKNRSVKGQPNNDRILRFLDCAVFRHLHSILEGQADGPERIEPFDTVRGMFVEGRKVYPGSGFRQQSHVQIAVINSRCIRGVFFPRD
jgi:hypothetical protein